MLMKTQRGLTLIELMVALAVFSIVVAVAAPQMKTFMKNNRQINKLNTMVSAINLARSEAARLGSTITICSTSDNATCTGETDWSVGFMVFQDTDRNGAIGAGETILRLFPETSADGTVLATAFDGANYDKTFIQFASRGELRDTDGTAATTPQGSFVFCDDRGATKARAINVNLLGRPGVATDTDNDNTVNDANNVNVSCQ